MNPTNPIGVFDSGVGGLSVLQHIRWELPREQLIYVADSAHVPYGNKPVAFIERRALQIVHFLLTRNVKAVVVACNTATAAAVATLRARHALPIVGMEPGLKPALALTRSGVVGILATAGTLTSDKFANLLGRFGGGARVLIQPCPGWVEQVEQAELHGAATRALVERFVRPLLDQGADTLVLGCTHYPFLLPLIKQVAGPGVTVIDTAGAVARELRRRLTHTHRLAPIGAVGSARFWTSGVRHEAQVIMARLWHGPVEVRRLPDAIAEASVEAGADQETVPSVDEAVEVSPVR